ncbi:MAG: hypothetical protein K0S61_1242 [Anaerocolumna sp.]|jgi:hypothetical protein|nr:hypothetical protein [Anaerocolumna sp.]
MRKKKRYSIIILIIFIISVIYYSPIIFQEANPIPVIVGIIKLYASDDSLVLISKNSDKFISKSSNGQDVLMQSMKEDGWSVTEQGGSAYIFSRDERKIVVTARHYTRKYLIWRFGEATKKTNKTEFD